MVSIFNLSLDDVCPCPQCDPFVESIKWCNKLIEKHPGIKIDFFIPAAFARLNEQPHFLSKYPEWIKKMNDLPKENYGFNAHSYFHRRLSTKHGNSNNNEVEKTTEQETMLIIKHMEGEFALAGIKCRRIFRAPGFHIGASAAKALTDAGYKIAGDKRYYDILNGKVKGMKYCYHNWDLNDECQIKEGNVLAVGHTSLWCKNAFVEKTYDRVIRLLDSRSFEFKFLDEMV